MGIGAALATGLVQGFTQNINNEKARRQGERDKVDKYQEILMNASLNPGKNFSASNAKLLGSMIQNANNQLDDQERINLFGQQGEDIDIDFSGVLSQLQGGTTAQQGYMIGSFDLTATMNEDIRERFYKDMGDDQKRADLIINGLNQYYQRVGEEQFKAKFSDMNDRNALRREFTSSVSSIFAGRDVESKGGKVAFSPEKQINNFDFFVDFLGINSDAEQEELLNMTLTNAVTAFNTDAGPGEQLSPDSFVPVNGNLFPNKNEKMLALDVDSLLDNDILMEDIDFLAASQGRSRNLFMYNFSKNYDNVLDFTQGLKHATVVGSTLRVGNKLEFTNMDSMIKVGEYLDTEVINVSEQARIMEGLIGSVLSKNQRQRISWGQATEDDFKAGTNRTSGFTAVMGEATNYAGFKERVKAARTARDQLQDYIKIVQGISTPAGSVLDSAAALVESFIGTGGKFDQIADMIGGNFKDNTDRESLERSFRRVSENSDGARARRDSLAFIIAAQMARAEDSQGRLSDGDLQRNLQKLTGKGPVTKLGEVGAIEVVMKSIDTQYDSLSELDLLIESPGAEQGFSSELRLKLQALKQRDQAISVYRNALARSGGTQPDDTQLPEITDVDQLINTEGFIFSVGKKEDPTTERVGSIQGQYYHIFPDGTFKKINVNEAELIYLNITSIENKAYLPPDATATNSVATEQNINQDKPSDDTGADVNNDPTPTNVDLIRGSNFAGMPRVPLGNNKYRFGDDPTIYEMITRPNAARQQATFYKKVN